MTFEYPEEVVYARVAERRRIDEAFNDMLDALEAVESEIALDGQIQEIVSSAIAKAKAIQRR